MVFHIAGHSLCKSCVKAVRSCPICRNVLSHTRNYALEAIAQQLRYPCKNINYGCEEKFTQAEMDEHLLSCGFRAYSCLLGTTQNPCTFKGHKNELRAHAKAKHEDKSWMTEENVDRISLTDPEMEILVRLLFV